MQLRCVELAICVGVGSRSPCASAAIAAKYVGSQAIVGRKLTSNSPRVAASAAATDAGSAVIPTGSDVKPPALSVAAQKPFKASPPRKYVSSRSTNQRFATTAPLAPRALSLWTSKKPLAPTVYGAGAFPT